MYANIAKSCIEFRSEDIKLFLQISNENLAAKKMMSFYSHCEIFRSCCESYWQSKIRANVIFVNIFDHSTSLSLSRSSIIKRIRESQIDWIAIENLLFFRFKENCIIFKDFCIRSRIIHSRSLNLYSTEKTWCFLFRLNRKSKFDVSKKNFWHRHSQLVWCRITWDICKCCSR